MEEVKVTGLQLMYKNERVTKYYLKIDGELYRYQTLELEPKTELFKYPSGKDFHSIKEAILPMDVTNPQKTIEQFYKTLMLQ
jgi:hypothetical protein